MPKEVIKYQCVYCRKKTYASKYKARDHEKICFFNPEVKSCATCDNRGFHPDYGDCWCRVYKKEVIKKGYPIRNCALWKMLDCGEQEGFYDE